MIEFHLLTIFPDYFTGPIQNGILKIAFQKGLARFVIHNLRDYTSDKHRSVDDRPYGGGPGMLLKPEPIVRAVEAIKADSQVPLDTILLTPDGERFSQGIAKGLLNDKGLLLICGHYEGFDERIRTQINARELSIGDYILSGGEGAALVIMDAVTRLIPGVLGDEASAKYETFENNMVDFPQYTRPRIFNGISVPDVLLSGNHAEIEGWRKEQARIKTVSKRPDLIGKERER